MIDSHVHLDFAEFDADCKDVLERATQSGVAKFVVPGVSVDTWPHLARFAEKHANVYVAFGLHPYFLEHDSTFSQAALVDVIEKNGAIAVGECGVDTSRPNLKHQISVFEQHIEVANSLEKPLIVHHRKSHHHILSCFKHNKPRYGGVIHAFSGSLQDAEKYLALGFALGCGGTITYDRAQKTKAVFKHIALEHILLETDAPAMPLSGKQGERNEPAHLKIIASALAQLREEPVAQIMSQTHVNTEALFGI